MIYFFVFIATFTLNMYLCYIIGWLRHSVTVGRKLQKILHEIKDGDDANQIINAMVDAHLDRNDYPWLVKQADKVYDWNKKRNSDETRN